MAVDVPVDCPDIGCDLIEELGLLDQIAEFGAKDFGEGFDGEEEIDLAGCQELSAERRAPPQTM